MPDLKAFRQPHANDRSAERRLRVGYVSADLKDHVVGRALLPAFERHDRAQFELVCYSSSPRDGVTDRFLARADLWREVTNLTDDQLAARIRTDGIDILVVLGLHTSDNCLGVFARKPAPVQVSWLGYPGTTGLEMMDYRLTDPFLEPPGAEPAASSEKPFRLPDADRPARNVDTADRAMWRTGCVRAPGFFDSAESADLHCLMALPR